MTYGSIPKMKRLYWSAAPILKPTLLFCPYGLTWLQRECGEILVKVWYVATALAEALLLLPSDVLLLTSGGYNTHALVVTF